MEYIFLLNIMERTWFDFQGLEIYKKSQEYYMNNKSIVSHGKPMLFAIDQLLRSAHSVVLNIAEGLGRITPSDRRHFFIIARGSLFESVACIDLFKKEKHVSEQIYIEMMDLAAEISRMLYTLIKNLTPSKPTKNVW